MAACSRAGGPVVASSVQLVPFQDQVLATLLEPLLPPNMMVWPVAGS